MGEQGRMSALMLVMSHRTNHELFHSQSQATCLGGNAALKPHRGCIVTLESWWLGDKVDRSNQRDTSRTYYFLQRLPRLTY